MTASPAFVALAVVVLTGAAPALAEEEWKTVVEGEITVKSRPRQGTGIQELWAEGELGAPVYDLGRVLVDFESWPRFMPYMKECRRVPSVETGPEQVVYTRLDFPVVSGRDYVVRVSVLRQPTVEGGDFESHWEAAPKLLPQRSNLVRLPVNDGSWQITAVGPERSKVVYRFAVDPGGWIPSVAADLGNKQAVTDTMRAVEQEARRRYAERLKAREVAAEGCTLPRTGTATGCP